MSEVSASLFALEQGKHALLIDEGECWEICAGAKKTEASSLWLSNEKGCRGAAKAVA
jgi:hypothetical protein